MEDSSIPSTLIREPPITSFCQWGELRAYKKFAKPIEISTADSGKIYAYGTDTLRVAALSNGLEQEENLQDVYCAPGVHARRLSLGKARGGMPAYARVEWSCGIGMGTCLPKPKG
jgi:hypothetical protein